MAINDISLTAGMRSNLVALQSTVTLLNRTQERLSTGKKVNTALDNPLNFFTAKALNSRAADLAGFKDGMSEAVQTIKAANNGITAIEGLIAQAKAVASTAKAGVEGGSGSWAKYTIDLTAATNGQTIVIGAQTFTAVATEIQKTFSSQGLTAGDQIMINGITYTASVGGTTALTSTTICITAALATGLTTNLDMLLQHVTANGGSGTLSGTSIILSIESSNFNITITSGGAGGTSTFVASNVTLSATQVYIGGSASDIVVANNLASRVNAFTDLVATVSGTHINLTDGASTLTLTSNTVTSAVTSMVTHGYQVTTDRSSYASQFEDIMDQLDLLATDSGYKGINFLAAGNSLDVEFGTSDGDLITLTGFSAAATSLLAKTDGLKTAYSTWALNSDIDVDIAALARATSTLKTESSRLSSGLSIINTRQDWVVGMVNTITEGSDKLTLADMNEEGANMLMLQTRQTLGTTALSLSAQAAQSVLRLFA